MNQKKQIQKAQNLARGGGDALSEHPRTAPADMGRALILPHGDTFDCPACGSHIFIGLEYRGTPCDYDGVSEWICQGCGKRFGRWTRRELLPGELERRYGGGQ